MSALKPVITEADLGTAGWRTLHVLARQRDRHPRDQIRFLLLYALDRALAGVDVELSKKALEALLFDELEPVA